MVRRLTTLLIVSVFTALPLPAEEDDYYRLITLPVPDDLRLEVSGLALLPDGRLATSIRKGEVWIVENPCDETGKTIRYRRFASGLHEPLGLAYRDGSLFTHDQLRMSDRHYGTRVM